MKNLKLGVKLVGGFILTALIIVAVGIVGLVEQKKLMMLEEELATEDLPAIQYLLEVKSEVTAIASLMRTLLTPYASAEQRQIAHQGLLDARKTYSETAEKFQNLDFAITVESEWRELSTHISNWATINNKAVEISDELVRSNMINPTKLNSDMSDFEIAHQSLLAKVGRLIAFNEIFEGGTDETTCSLGKWLDNMDTTNQDITALARELKPVHQKLHQIVSDVKVAVAENRSYYARDITLNELTPASESVFELVGKMKHISDEAYASFQHMNTLLLQDASIHQEKTLQTIDAIIAKAEIEAEQTVKKGYSIARAGTIITSIGIGIGVVMALVLGFYLTFHITRPLAKGVDLSKAMAEGDMTQIMDVDQQDEIGVLAKSLNEMAANLRKILSEVSKGVEGVTDSSNQLAMISDQMSSGAENTAQRSGQVAAAAEEMSANQNTIAAAMEQASTNVNMVAAAVEEMSATILEIAKNSTRAKEITEQAVDQSQKASGRVNELGRAADEINKVTEAITEISEQTNLLALNATIEAARAGEAGKGFAVVANEIKDLAKQTAEATLEIKSKIQAIQQATGITVKEINEISTVIRDVDQIVATIAVAVEEQTATTREISENISQASSGITEVNQNVAQSSTVSSEIAADIAEVSSSAEEMNQSSSQVKNSAGELSHIAIDLKGIIATFKV
jgi:methyl-accepting chemotaxis protein